MDIDGTISSAPFAELEGNDSYFSSEGEILFSMHTIFRIDEVTEIGDRLWYVQLKLTSDQDKELLCLSKKIRAEIRGSSAWYRLSHLLGKMGKFNEATDVLLELSNTISKNNWIFRSAIDHQLGVMHRERGNYDVALKSYNKALKYLHHISPIDHQSLGITYNDIGEIHRERGNNLEALKYFQKTLDHFEKSFNDIDPWHFATLYSNIGQVFRSTEIILLHLDFFEKH
jgi:tetratricopeptide (TPR) repeat protein